MSWWGWRTHQHIPQPELLSKLLLIGGLCIHLRYCIKTDWVGCVASSIFVLDGSSFDILAVNDGRFLLLWTLCMPCVCTSTRCASSVCGPLWNEKSISPNIPMCYSFLWLMDVFGTAVIFCLSIAVRFLPHRAVQCLYFVYWEFCETCDLTANIHALFLIMMHLNLNGTSLCWRHSSSVALLVSSLCLFHRYTDQQSFSSHFEFLATERLCI